LPLAKKVVIAADNDDGGTGLEAARKARELWRSQGRKVFIASDALEVLSSTVKPQDSI